MLGSTDGGGLAGGRVLVVDDDPKFVRIAVRRLERAGYDCVTGESGDHALWAVADQRPDVIVLDVMMPHPSGIEVCRHLRADGWTGGVVVVSAGAARPTAPQPSAPARTCSSASRFRSTTSCRPWAG